MDTLTKAYRTLFVKKRPLGWTAESDRFERSYWLVSFSTPRAKVQPFPDYQCKQLQWALFLLLQWFPPYWSFSTVMARKLLFYIPYHGKSTKISFLTLGHFSPFFPLYFEVKSSSSNWVSHWRGFDRAFQWDTSFELELLAFFRILIGKMSIVNLGTKNNNH